MVLWGMLLWRENQSLRALSEIVDVPKVTQAYAPPNGREMKFLGRTLTKGPQYNRIVTPEDSKELSKTIAASGDYDMWVIETPLSPPDVRRFYEDESHRRGWQLASDAEIVILLKREDKSMLISFDKSKSGKGTTVIYYLEPAPKTPKD